MSHYARYGKLSCLAGKDLSSIFWERVKRKVKTDELTSSRLKISHALLDRDHEFCFPVSNRAVKLFVEDLVAEKPQDGCNYIVLVRLLILECFPSRMWDQRKKLH